MARQWYLISLVSLSVLCGSLQASAIPTRFELEPEFGPYQPNYAPHRPTLFPPQYRDLEEGGLTENTYADYWRETNLKFHHFVDDFVEECNKRLENFRGCFDGLEVLAGLSDSRELILGTQDFKSQQHPFIGDEVESLPSGLKLYVPKIPVFRDRMEVRATLAKVRAIKAKAVEKLFASKAKLDFRSLF